MQGNGRGRTPERDALLKNRFLRLGNRLESPPCGHPAMVAFWVMCRRAWSPPCGF